MYLNGTYVGKKREINAESLLFLETHDDETIHHKLEIGTSIICSKSSSIIFGKIIKIVLS